MLYTLFPFLKWFPLTISNLRNDTIAGVTVAMILIPQSMAYAALAGLPVVYGLYASFLPVMIASMWGASRFLHTGPVAMLSLMSAAAIEPLATRGSEDFIQLSLVLAFMVGALRLALGLFRMGVLINLASSPVIIGFTNAAALIIGSSLLYNFLNVPMPRSDNFLADLWQVILQVPIAHGPTILFGIGTVIVLKVVDKIIPRIPGVLVVVFAATIISAVIGFEKVTLVDPKQIADPLVRETYEELMANDAKLKKIKQDQKEIGLQINENQAKNLDTTQLQASLMRLKAEESSLKLFLYHQQVDAYQHALLPMQEGDQVKYVLAEKTGFFEPRWRWSGYKDGQVKLSGGGMVVGNIPSGLPTFSIPTFDLSLMAGLFSTAFIMAMIGFMEATSISRALAAKTREKLNSNQELIGQGLANIIGSFFQSYAVSGSFSRSAVAARVGAKTGFYAIISALGVVLVMMFFTEYLHHLPMAVLAAIVMSAVFGLVDFKPMIHAWNVRRGDGIIGFATFATTILMAPSLADGVLTGVILTILILLADTMKPRSVILGKTEDGYLRDVKVHNIPPLNKNFITMRFDGSLIFINAAYFEESILKAVSEAPDANTILIIAQAINRIDATGEEKLRTLVSDLKNAGITLALAGVKKPVWDTMDRAGLIDLIGPENIFGSKQEAFTSLAQRSEPSSQTSKS